MAPIAAKGDVKEGRGDTEGREYRSLKKCRKLWTRCSDVDALRKRGLIPDGKLSRQPAPRTGTKAWLAAQTP